MTQGGTRRGSHTVPDLVARARQGDPAAVARLITLVEDASPLLREVMSALGPDAGGAHVLGITGAPGVGKSTSTNALVTAMRRAGRRVGVLAIDPSSPFSGGALLGDRAVDFTYEEMCTDPAAVGARIARLVPPLHDLDLGQTLPVKGHYDEPLDNMNARQIARLSVDDRNRIDAIFDNHRPLLAAFGYDRIDP